MTILPRSFTRYSTTDGRSNAARGLLVIAALLVTVVFILMGEEIGRLGAYGYPAVFLISLLSNAALLLPTPGIALVIAAGGSLDPVLVGVVAGLGAAMGEMSGYVIGQSGQTILEQRPIYWRIERWMRKSGTLVIFLLATIPNPLFDVGGLIAGALRMPIWRFLVTVWVGKSIRFALLATIGSLAI